MPYEADGDTIFGIYEAKANYELGQYPEAMLLVNKTIELAERKYPQNLNWDDVDKATQRGFTRYWPEYTESLALSLLIGAQMETCCSFTDPMYDLYMERLIKLIRLGYDVEKLDGEINTIMAMKYVR